MCGCEQGTCPGDCDRLALLRARADARREHYGAEVYTGASGDNAEISVLQFNTEALRRKRFTIARQPSCFLVGASWAHHVTFKARSTHVYLGFWVLTIKTKATS